MNFIQQLSCLRRVCSFLFLTILITSCHHDPHFITNKAYREKVEIQFEKQKKLAKQRSEQLFKVFDEDLTTAEQEALKFLYAYMPLSDLADYDGGFYLQHVRATLAARDTFSWGKQIPEVIFRHFVLPVRVNNENLDSARWVFFSEIKDRVRNLTMKEAVLEVNHWCHEKVTYRGTDGRTSAPLATVKTAFGRCGEESTLTVAALRSVGIPARQCYTPRWAHCDDNHAWVEVWVDGKWHFIGACEPEPDLDIAWFTAPAKRAMLVNTNVFGDYDGPEDVLLRDERFTRINILPNYTQTRRIMVRVMDKNMNPVDSARVEFQLYNYAEFYPLYTTFSDPQGRVSFQTGYGDLIIRAAKNGFYSSKKVNATEKDTIGIVLDQNPGMEYMEEYDLIPPQEQNVVNERNDSLQKSNAEKLSFEDRIRLNYESTFIDSGKTYRLAGILKMNPDTLWFFLKKSRGNWRELIDFISEIPLEFKHLTFPLLSSVSEKDLRDVNPEVLSDHILHSNKYEHADLCRDMYVQYILCPRIDNEWLKPYKAFFQEKFDSAFILLARNNPRKIMEWIKSNIAINKTANYSRAPLTPRGVYELRISDEHSRDIFFIAVCRSFGIAARLEPGTRIPQYFLREKWMDVFFDEAPSESGERGTLILSSDPGNKIIPEYYTHFTIGKFSEGFFTSLDYEDHPLLKSFPCSLYLAPGYYVLVSGNRITGGIVLAEMQYFNIEADRLFKETIHLRTHYAPLAAIGKLDLNTLIPSLVQEKNSSFHTDNGLILAWMEPDKEPTKHFVAEMKAKKTDFEKWKGNIFLFFKNDQEKHDFQQQYQTVLPGGTHFCTAHPSGIKTLAAAMKQSEVLQRPLVCFLNDKAEILYFSTGYRIGLGNDLVNIISAVSH